MSKQIIESKKVPAPIGPYSQAILANGMLFISGQCPINPKTGLLEMETIESATHLVMSNIEKLLHAAEMAFTHIVKCSIFLKDLGDFQKVNAVFLTDGDGDVVHNNATIAADNNHTIVSYKEGYTVRMNGKNVKEKPSFCLNSPFILFLRTDIFS